jgi:aromatic-L-amino-acid/L-tryptophan decarboxylase
MPSPSTDDMSPAEFRDAAARLTEWAAHYLETVEQRRVGHAVVPGLVRSALPTELPADGASFEVMLGEVERVLMPGVTHWNHPGFMAYFPSSGSGPGVLGEYMTALLNQQAMLWSTSPAASELEDVVLTWLCQLLGLPPQFEGVCHEGGSASNLHAMVAALAATVPEFRARGLAGRGSLPRPCVYASSHAHASIAKAVVLLGMGDEALRTVPVDDQFRMRPADLAARMAADRRAGWLPVAVVATVGTTSTGSVDPVAAVVQVCAAERVWCHVDASYGGAAALVSDCATLFDGVASADSIVVNPHKWLFTPVDLSVFYCRRLDVLRELLHVSPEYLAGGDPPGVRNVKDAGMALGRRFRALKLWMVLRYFGAAGLQTRIAAHLALAQELAAWVDADPGFERLAPVSLSVVCFRAVPNHLRLEDNALDDFNAELLRRVNADGHTLLSSTRLRGCLALRVAIGHVRTSDRHVARAWESIRASADALLREYQAAGWRR